MSTHRFSLAQPCQSNLLLTKMTTANPINTTRTALSSGLPSSTFAHALWLASSHRPTGRDARIATQIDGTHRAAEWYDRLFPSAITPLDLHLCAGSIHPSLR
jgi:hypothetical protein